MTAIERFVAGVRAMGSDARDLRDAAHEAHHAIAARLRRPWERERIHRALLRMPRVRKWGVAMLVQEEVDARAVEQLTCGRYALDYDREHWAMMAAMESFMTFGTAMQLDWWMDQIAQRVQAERIVVAADRLVARMEGRR